jgi:ABC-type Zn uptake system ZnuABC Zn-binding protein ZnuA
MRAEASIGIALAALAVLAAGCGNARAPDRPAKTQVAATIFPLADALRRIGGEDVEVHCLVGVGQSPHHFQPRPEHAEIIRRVRLLVRVGMGVDDWAEQIARAAGRGGGRVLALAADPAFQEMLEALPPGAGAAERGEGHGPARDRAGGRETGPDTRHPHETGDPHVWLDPVFMRHFAGLLAEALARADAAGADGYRRRGRAYAAELTTLDAEYRRALAGVRHRHFVTFHPAFTYVARRYGLTQRALRGGDAEGFGTGRLEEIRTFIRAHRVRALFAEPQFPADRLEALAEATGVKVGRLDPLGNPGLEGYDSYLAMMRSNLKQLCAALRD